MPAKKKRTYTADLRGKRRPAKTEVEKCSASDCKDPFGGPIPPDCVTPKRISGARFGKKGRFCLTCYRCLYKRFWRANRSIYKTVRRTARRPV